MRHLCWDDDKNRINPPSVDLQSRPTGLNARYVSLYYLCNEHGIRDGGSPGVVDPAY